MLESYFSYRGVLKRLRSGALDEFELLLRKYDVQPKVLVNTNTGPNSVLESPIGDQETPRL